MDVDTSYAAMSVGRQLLFHLPKNCTRPAIEQFPAGILTQEQRLQGGLIVHITAVIYIIAALGVISHEYFVPAMEKLLAITKIDPDIAGAAVMATAASTPQLATAVIGVFVAKSDIGVGAVVGSSYFNIFFIVGLCAVVAKEPLRLAWWAVLRDVFFYIVSASVLAILLADQKATWWNGLVLVLVYVVYVVALVFNARVEHAVTRLLQYLRLGFTRCRCKRCRDRDRDCEDCSLVQEQRSTKKHDEMKVVDTNSNSSAAEHTEVSQGSSYQSCDEGTTVPAGAGYTVTYYTFPGHPDNAPEGGSSEEYHSVLQRPQAVWRQVVWGLMLPALLVIFLLIPDCRRPNSWRYLFVFTILMSVVVICCNAFLLVWMVTVVGSTVGIPDTTMGLTFLAAGASVPDMLNAVFVARHGYGDMAVSNCLGSNIFDVLVCLGLPWFMDILFTRRSYPLLITEDVSSISVTLIASAFILFCCLFITNWRINKLLGALFMAAYVGFVIFTSLFSKHTALPTCETKY